VPLSARAALCLLAVLSSSCTCGGERDEREPHRDRGSEGGDLGRLEPFGDPEGAPALERFVLIDPALGEGAIRARSWAGAAALRGDSDRDDPGNFLCRLWAHYGAPPEITEDGFRYALRDTELDQIVVALLDARGPSLAAITTDAEGHRIDEEQLAASVDALASALDATRPIDCTLGVGGRNIGVHDELSLR